MGIASKRSRLMAVCLCLASPVFAQDGDSVWTVYVVDNPTRCWVAAEPTGTVATRGDQDVSNAITRDTAMLMISFWPEDGRLAEVSYSGGYPFETGSVVTAVSNDETFELFTEGPMSWAGSPQQDQAMIAAMRAGSEIVMTASSTRGTQVVDTFSLQGFTAAIDDAEARCSG
jgi:hypothetical protein